MVSFESKLMFRPLLSMIKTLGIPSLISESKNLKMEEVIKSGNIIYLSLGNHINVLKYFKSEKPFCPDNDF